MAARAAASESRKLRIEDMCGLYPRAAVNITSQVPIPLPPYGGRPEDTCGYDDRGSAREHTHLSGSHRDCLVREMPGLFKAGPGFFRRPRRFLHSAQQKRLSGPVLSEVPANRRAVDCGERGGRPNAVRGAQTRRKWLSRASVRVLGSTCRRDTETPILASQLCF